MQCRSQNIYAPCIDNITALRMCSAIKQNREGGYSRKLEKKIRFKLFFLGKKYSDVKVREVEKIDFKSVMKHLECGESIFISDIRV
jgi:hypothetical protein